MAFTPQLVGTTSSSQTVTLTNQGKTPLTIASISASGSFEVNNTCGKKLAVGAACDLNISFKPSGKGNIPGLITVVDSATSKPQIIEVSGVGTVVELTPQSLNFGEQKVGTRSGPLPIVITNQGVSSIAISQITTNSANYSETNNCPSQLASGASCTVKVTFKPVKAGTMDAILNVKDSGGGASQSVTLTGIGD
jgi:hypothetical protein